MGTELQAQALTKQDCERAICETLNRRNIAIQQLRVGITAFPFWTGDTIADYCKRIYEEQRTLNSLRNLKEECEE